MIFSGTRIALKDTTIQDKVDSVYLPVSSGLEQALFSRPVETGKLRAGRCCPAINHWRTNTKYV